MDQFHHAMGDTSGIDVPIVPMGGFWSKIRWGPRMTNHEEIESEDAASCPYGGHDLDIAFLLYLLENAPIFRGNSGYCIARRRTMCDIYSEFVALADLNPCQLLSRKRLLKTFKTLSRE